MKEWILPFNSKYYRLEDAFKELKIIDWAQTQPASNISEGDVVYIYLSAPDSRIAYKGAVLKANKMENTIDDSMYHIPPTYGLAKGRFMELALFRVYEIDGLDLESLQENGLTYRVQGPMAVNDELANYLHTKDIIQRNSDCIIDETPDVCLNPFPIVVDDGEVDIQIPMSPEYISEDGKKVKCRVCGSEFMKAPRCTTCGQKIKYSNVKSNLKSDTVVSIDYEQMLKDINMCETKKELMDIFNKYGFRSVTKPTDTQNSGDLYFQFSDGSRLHCQKTQFTVYTCPTWTKLYFDRYTFKECKDGSYRTRKASVPKTVEELKYILSVFVKDSQNLL